MNQKVIKKFKEGTDIEVERGAVMSLGIIASQVSCIPKINDLGGSYTSHIYMSVELTCVFENVPNSQLN